MDRLCNQMSQCNFDESGTIQGTTLRGYPRLNCDTPIPCYRCNQQNNILYIINDVPGRRNVNLCCQCYNDYLLYRDYLGKHAN